MPSYSRSTALERLQSVFREQFLDDSLKITEATSPETIEEWDSLAHVGLLAGVEAAFGVRFTADEMGEIGDVATLLDALMGKWVTV